MFFESMILEVFSILGGLFLLATFAEYIGRVWEFPFKLTDGLDVIIFYLRKFFKKVGEVFAQISSFYIRLRLQELFLSAWAVWVRCGRLLSSPTYAIFGYLQASFTYAYPILVYGGTATIVAGLGSILLYYTYETVYELWLYISEQLKDMSTEMRDVITATFLVIPIIIIAYMFVDTQVKINNESQSFDLVEKNRRTFANKNH